MGKLATYTRKHERPFALRYPNGKRGVIELRFNDGYVTIYSRQPGVRGYEQEIHITKKLWFRILWYEMRQIKTVTKLMEGPSFDCYRAQRRYYRAEAEHQAEMRELKRSLYRRPRRRRRRA